MRALIKSLIGDTVVYGISGVVSAAIGLFLIPIYTSAFTPAEYGIISLINTTQALVSILIIFGLDNSVATWFYSHTTETERQKTFSTWFMFSFFIGVIVALFLFLASDLLSKVILGDASYAILIKIMAVNVFLVGINKIPNILFRVRRKPIHSVLQAISISLITIGFAIYFVLNLKLGLLGAVWAQCAGAFSGFLFSLVFLSPLLKVKNFDKKLLIEMIKFSFPLIPVSLMLWGQGSAMSYLLNMYVPKSEIGIFQFAVSCSGVIGLLTYAFFQAWTPFALSIRHKEESTKVYVRVFHSYALFGTLIVWSVTLLSPIILRTFANERYYMAASLIGYLSLNVFLAGVPQILSIVNNFAKNNTPLIRPYFVSSITTVVSFFIFIQYWQKESAVYAMLVGSISLCIYNFTASQKLIHFPYNTKFLILCLISALTVVIAFS